MGVECGVPVDSSDRCPPLVPLYSTDAGIMLIADAGWMDGKHFCIEQAAGTRKSHHRLSTFSGDSP